MSRSRTWYRPWYRQYIAQSTPQRIGFSESVRIIVYRITNWNWVLCLVSRHCVGRHVKHHFFLMWTTVSTRGFRKRKRWSIQYTCSQHMYVRWKPCLLGKWCRLFSLRKVGTSIDAKWTFWGFIGGENTGRSGLRHSRCPFLSCLVSACHLFVWRVRACVCAFDCAILGQEDLELGNWDLNSCSLCVYRRWMDVFDL
jgi:hypothetical protein